MVVRRWHKEDKTLKMLCPWFFLRIFEIDDVIVAITTGCATMEAHVSCVEFYGESFDGGLKVTQRG